MLPMEQKQEQRRKLSASESRELLDILDKILQRGNTAEVKKEREQVVVVEIQRQVRIKKGLYNWVEGNSQQGL